MQGWKGHWTVGVLLAAGVLSGSLGSARAADHRDAPAINDDSRADINDVYAFVNPNNGNVVLALTVNPFIVPGAPGVGFSPNVLYEFKIDNTGDFREDRVIQATFTDLPNQMVTLTGPVPPAGRPRGSQRAGVSLPAPPALQVTGPANGTVFAGSGLRGFAGVRDDPFFFDLVFVFRVLGILPGGAPSRSPGIDFFAGINTSVLAVEVPPALLRGTTGNTIRIWATTSRPETTTRFTDGNEQGTLPFIQLDRMGLPTINTVLISSARKDQFNRSIPADDPRLFRSTALATLTAVNGNAAYSAQIVDVLLPDVLTLDVTNTGGFLNGRRPQDDVIDTVLQVASNNAVRGDGVNANDVPFLADFPFFAVPHGPEATLRPRN